MSWCTCVAPCACEPERPSDDNWDAACHECGSMRCGCAFGKNQMPGELASKVLTEAADLDAQGFGPPLRPVDREFLEILAEECAETIQRVTKILRFGVRANPWNGKDNLDQLQSEIGDICATLDVLSYLGVVQEEKIYAHADRKLRAFAIEEDPTRPRIRHATAEMRARLLKMAGASLAKGPK